MNDLKRVNDRGKIEAWIEKAHIRDYFSTPDLNFLLYQYDKGEQLIVPNKNMDRILFVVDGMIRIYGLRENGTISPVNQQNAPIILGDIEFSTHENSTFFAEAATEVTCLALPVRKYEKQLHCDILFLHALLQSCAKKLQFFALVDASAETIEERVLLYLKNFCPTHELTGIEAAILQLRCSRRQLQRVLKKLCQEGKVEKTGKGRYRLLACEQKNKEYH